MFTRLWRAPPIDVFPAYGQSPASTTADYLTDADFAIVAYGYDG
jgi:hypothetical protein